MNLSTFVVVSLFSIISLVGCATSQITPKLVLGDNPANIAMPDNARLAIAGPLVCDTFFTEKNNSRFSIPLIEESTRWNGSQKSTLGTNRIAQVPASENTVFSIGQTNTVGYAVIFFEMPIEGGATYWIDLVPVLSGIFDSNINFKLQVLKNGKPTAFKPVPLPNNDSCDFKPT